MLIRLVLLPLCCILILIIINGKANAASTVSQLNILSDEIIHFVNNTNYSSANTSVEKVYELIEDERKSSTPKTVSFAWLEPIYNHKITSHLSEFDYHLGYIAYYQKDYKKAEQYFIKILNAPRDSITPALKIKTLLVSALSEIKSSSDIVKIKKHLNKIKTLLDIDSTSLYNIKVDFLLAQLASKQKRFSKAIKLYQHILSVQKNTLSVNALIDIHQGLFDSYLSLGSTNKAAYHIQEVIALIEQQHLSNHTQLEQASQLSQQKIITEKKIMADEYEVTLSRLEYLTFSLSFLLVLLWLKSKNHVRTMQKLATRDELTGLQNRRALMAFALKEWHRSIRFSRPYCCIAIDIDHFKNINDTWGHATGDEVLKIISKNINSSLRVTDNLGRIGGEEFLLICIETNINQAIALAERIRIHAASIAYKHAPQQPVTISLGIAQLQNQSSLDELMANADQALYTSKRNGRNRVTVYQDNKNDDKTS